MNLRDLDIAISYTTAGEESFSKVINPLLNCTKVYKRSVGFFSSSALDFIGVGVKQIADNGGHIYLATSPKLSDVDIEAINKGYEEREILKRAFVSELKNALYEISDENAKALYEYVKKGVVDVKIIRKNHGMYHDKLALLEDWEGNVVACVGSNNETAPGYDGNYEKVRVYRSWFDYEGRIEDETAEFDSIWKDKKESLSVYDFMDAFKENLLERVEHNTGGIKGKKYEMRQYQKDAKNAWIENNHRGFFVMATGTGKTITSLYSVQDLVYNNKIFTVIAVPYKHLVSQWEEDVKEFFPDAYVICVHGEIKNAETKVFTCYQMSKKAYKPIIVITTIKSFFLEKYANLYGKIQYEKLLIVDEAHNFFNRMSESLSQQYQYKLGLSATPVYGHNKEKTELLLNWFGGKVVDFPIEKAIGKHLVNYEYHPIFVNATEDDEQKFYQSTLLMMSAIDPKRHIVIDEEKFGRGYRGRLKAIAMAENKVSNIQDIFNEINDTDHTIIYCSDGKIHFELSEKENEAEEIRHLEYVLKLINNEIIGRKKGQKASKFTAAEDISTRMKLIDNFEKGLINYLVAIRCLDEGINIPSITSALILSSSDNYREFVQRRGRILRKDGKKTKAHIYDVIVLPSLNNKSFAEIEFRRYYEYCRIAENSDELLLKLQIYLDEYGLTIDDVKFNIEYEYGGELDE